MKKRLIWFHLAVLLGVLTPWVATAELSIVVVNSPGSGDPGDWLTFIVEVREDGSPASGKTVTFSISPDNGTLSFLGGTSTYTTHDNGRVAQTLVLGSDASGSYTVTASVGSVSVSRTATVKTPLLPPDEPPTRTFSRAESTPFHPGDTVRFIASVRQVKDGVNQGVSGETVTFSLSPDDGTASLSTTSGTTDSNGSAETTLTLSSSASGRYQVTATFGDGTSKTHSTGTVYNSSPPAPQEEEPPPPQEGGSPLPPPEEEEPPSPPPLPDKPTVELEGISSSHDSVRENDGQATTITLTVTLDKTAATDETITLAIVSPTQGKTAKRGEDFDAILAETLTIAKGQRTGTAQLTLTPKDNTTADGDKAFAVQATSSSGHAALINIKIIDNEAADEPQARLTPDPATVAFSAGDPAWKTFTVHTNLDSVLVRANPAGSDPALEVAGGQQVPTRDFCPAEGNDRPTRGRRDGWSLHVKACQAGQTKILLIDYDTGEVVQEYEVNVAGSGIAATTALNPSYPNPFNSETTLSYRLPTASDIRLEVFTLSGQRVAVLHEGFQAAGYHTLSLDASDLASGVYLYRLTTPKGRFVQKFTLLR